MLSPELIHMLRVVQRSQDFTVSDPPTLVRMHHCLSTLSLIVPRVDGKDRIWRLWLRTQRGSLEDFGDVEECVASGDFESREDFEEFWRSEFPEAIQWWHLSAVHFPNELWFTVESKLQFGVDLDAGLFKAVNPAEGHTSRFLDWLLAEIDRNVAEVCADPGAYNAQVASGLPLRKRYGRILRKELWREARNPRALRAQFEAVDIPAFERLVREVDEQAVVPEMTLASYLGYCKTCYEAVGYERLSSVRSAIGMYRRMADQRDDGMLSLPPDDAAAFDQWMNHGRRGGHPFEICRGGSSTHISLYPRKRETGWQLQLAGFSRARIAETARMALALHRGGAPLVIQDKEEMLRMLTGIDFIGIVPDDEHVGYNHSSFPREDRIFDFAHLWEVEAVCGAVPDSIHWYPLDEIRPVAGAGA